MNRDSIAGFLIGVGAGAAIGLFCAPRPGAETRRALADAAREKADSIKQQATGLWDVAQSKIEETKSSVQRAQTGIRSAAEAGMQAYRGATTS